jgi:prophage DNA circulation protein
VSWRDDLGKVRHPDGRRLIGASFRGVAFFVEEVQRSGGRRTHPHEFPGGDDPHVDDLGRRARVFPVTGYVLGDDYVSQRDKLIEALEDVPGPGRLAHPYYGTRRAICSGFDTRESISSGGVAEFTIEFTETPAQDIAPVEAFDPAGDVSLSADAALAANADEFAADFDTDDLPSHAIASSTAVIQDMSASLNDALSPIIEVTSELASMNQELTILSAEASSLVREPGEILGSFQSALAVVAETALGAPLSVLQAFSSAYLTDLGPEPPDTTPTRQRELANRQALERALKRILVIEAARLAPLGAYDSIDYAIATRDQLVAHLDEQAELAGDATYQAIMDLRASLTRAVPGEANLARVVTLSQRTAIPSILLAYRLYGSVDGEDDIIARNRPRHPGFMAGDLEVLSDA